MNRQTLTTARTKTWGETYTWLLGEATSHGSYRRSRDGDTKELGPTMLHIADGPKFSLLPGRGGLSLFAEVEQLCYLSGSDPEPLTVVSERYANYKDHADAGGAWWGAYGPRLFPMLPEVCNELYNFPDSRRAVAPIFEPRDIRHASENGSKARDIPCTTGISFWNDSKLNLLQAHATMRSCDLWYGLYYDGPSYRMLQRAVAWATWKYLPGDLWITITSCHLYERHYDKALNVSSVPSSEWELELPFRNDFPRDPKAAMLELQAWAAVRLRNLIANIHPASTLEPSKHTGSLDKSDI